MSLAGLRRASVNAVREQEHADREREFQEHQEREQEEYDALKSSIRQQLAAGALGCPPGGPVDDEGWDRWWAKQVKAKWLDTAWEQHLPAREGTSGLQEMLLRDVRQELQRDRCPASPTGAIAAAAEGLGPLGPRCSLPIRTATGLGPTPKRLAAPRPDVALPATGQRGSAADPQEMEYVDLFTAFVPMDFTVCEAESAARCNSSGGAAVEWLNVHKRGR